MENKKPKFKFVDELPGISKSSRYDDWFTELEKLQKEQKPARRKWVEFKIGSKSRVSIPLAWRERFDMSTRTIWTEGQPEATYNVYVKLKDSVV